MKAYKNLLLECFCALVTTQAFYAFYGLERLAWAKHSSLFQTLVNCRRKIFITLGPGNPKTCKWWNTAPENVRQNYLRSERGVISIHTFLI